jgi:dolichol-phosphate mannosyltransferase
MNPTLSVVLPVYDERENIEHLFARLAPALEDAAGTSWEVVFVDDGSRDGSSEMLDLLAGRERRVRVVHLSRNFGHQAALQAGLDRAEGSAVVLMDADLQDPPELVPELARRWREGFEVVYALRRGRKEGLPKRAAYALFYRTLKAISEIDLPADAGDFCLLDRRVVDALAALPERNRFLRGLRSWVGFRQVGVQYERDARASGKPKYTLSKLVRLALSGYVGFSALPLRAAAWLGFAAAAVGFAVGVWAIVTRLLQIPSPRGWASTIAVILFVGGIQLLVLGVIGEYLGRVYDEVRRRPTYIVGSEVGTRASAVERHGAASCGEGRERAGR